MGWVALKMLYFLITHSTWILTKKQNSPTDSCMSKPLSAKMTSPGVKWSRWALFSVRCVSLTLPPHPSEIKLTVTYLAVLWCLFGPLQGYSKGAQGKFQNNQLSQHSLGSVCESPSGGFFLSWVRLYLSWLAAFTFWKSWPRFWLATQSELSVS